MTGVGLVLLVIGARFLVDSATTIAREFGISEAVIGLTIVAVGTSLPEFATSVIAALRKQTEISVGNIVGSNIFNIFGILGLTALIAPIPAEARFAAIDMWWAAGSAIGLTVVAFLLGGLPRLAGLVLLASYGAYLWFMGRVPAPGRPAPPCRAAQLGKLRSAAVRRNKSSKTAAGCDIFVLQIRLTPGIPPPYVPTEREGDGPMARLLVIVGRMRMGR